MWSIMLIVIDLFKSWYDYVIKKNNFYNHPWFIFCPLLIHSSIHYKNKTLFHYWEDIRLILLFYTGFSSSIILLHNRKFYKKNFLLHFTPCNTWLEVSIVNFNLLELSFICCRLPVCLPNALIVESYCPELWWSSVCC